MSNAVNTFTLSSTDMTVAFATQLGSALIKGDALLLEGDIGAGKSFFARALIQSLQDNPEDVPSPTFTLVQTYDTRSGEIWHADLYRLSDPSEADELGLLDAFTNAICLIEWPDRLGDLKPEKALTLTFQTSQHDDARQVTFDAATTDLAKRLLKALS